eukprot:SAG11_NODE_1147_length_5683_cov_40.952006_7_plen_49_part_00
MYTTDFDSEPVHVHCVGVRLDFKQSRLPYVYGILVVGHTKFSTAAIRR